MTAVETEIEPTAVFASLDSYLGEFAGAMADRVGVGLAPLFDPEKDPLSPEVKSLTDCEMVPYPAQAVGVEAMVRNFEQNNSGWIVGECGTGKAQPTDSLVLTPDGWMRIGDLAIGSKVVCPDGSVANVIGVHPQGYKHTCQVIFSDGTSTECCSEHLWYVTTQIRKWRNQPGQVLTTTQLKEKRLRDKVGRHKWFIPLVQPADLDRGGDRPLDPYILGLLLGDSCLGERSVLFSTADAELLDAIESLATSGVTIKQHSRYDYRISCGIRGGKNWVLTALRDLQLAGKYSYEKFVPDAYLWASADDRLAILQGLFDTDGSLSGSSGSRGSAMASNVDYTTTSKQLADDVRFLVESLGGTLKQTERITHYTHKGERRAGRLSYRQFIRLPRDIYPFRLPRKADRYGGPTKYGPSRAVEKINHLSEKPMVCIRVDHPDQLYVTNNFIVTHNTPMGLWTVRVMEQKLGRPMRVVITAPNQLAKKWRRHCQIVLPGCRAVIIKNWKCLNELVSRSVEFKKTIAGDGEPMKQRIKRWRDPECTEVWILPRDRGKLGYAWTTGVSHTQQLVKYEKDDGEEASIEVTQFRCPRCGSPILNLAGKEAGLEHFVNKRGKLAKKQICQHCHEPLWQAYNGSNGLREFLKREAAVQHRKYRALPVNGKRRARKRDRSPACYPRMPVPKVSPRRMAPCQYLRKIGFKFDMYIADECFVGSTPIETPRGPVRIDSLHPGDLVVTADDQGHILARPISRVIQKPSSRRRMVRIVHEHGEFVSTPQHWIYTTDGKIAASSVTKSTILLQSSHAVRDENLPLLRPPLRVPREADGQACADVLQPVMCSEDSETPALARSTQRNTAGMSAMRQSFHPPVISGTSGLLLSVLFDEASVGQSPDDGSVCSAPRKEQDKSSTQSSFDTNEAHEQNTRVSSQIGCDEAGETIRRNPWGKWLADPAAGEARQGVVVANRVSRQDGGVFMEVRRRGHRVPGDQVGNRGRWGVTSYKEAEEPGSPQRADASQCRLGILEILEQRDRQRSAEGRPSHTSRSRVLSVEEIEVEEAVYDLEVEETHRYFAGGALVSNCHELKGRGTLQGQMFADLCLLSTYRLMLTGTLVGGYANNLLHLLWRTIPFRLAGEGLAHTEKGFHEYVELYGVLQTVKRYVAANNWQSETDLVMGRGKQVSSRMKVLPGISPVLFVNFMLDQAVFLRLQEMSAHLPQFSERIHAVPHTVAQDQAMHAMQRAFEDHRKRTRPCRAWSAARHVFLRWPDKPWVDEFDVMDRDEDDRPIFAFHVPSLPRQEYPKERRVRRIVQRNIARGRKTWVFTGLSGRERAPFWDHMDYLASYLEGHGIRTAVLRSNNDGGPKPEDREEWIERIGPTVDVVISNPTLVQTGLDLYDFPSICFAFCGDNTYTLRQASRRAYRLGQKEPCEVDYVVYAGQQTCDKQPIMDGPVITGWTRLSQAKHVQDAAMSLMSKKMQASLAIEGDFSAEGLAALSETDDMASQLARFIDGRLNDLEPATTAFEKYRAVLEACMPELGAQGPPAPAESEIAAPPADEAPAPAKPEIVPPAVSREDDVNQQAAFDLLVSLGIEVVSPPEPEPVKTEAEEMFEQPALARSEPSSIRERKALRLKALCEAMGCEPSESAGDRHLFGDFWYQLVAKRRGTVRERNFAAIHADHDTAMIAFVEPVDEAGPTASPERQTTGGVEYVISTMFVNQYLAGERTPGGVIQPPA